MSTEQTSLLNNVDTYHGPQSYKNRAIDHVIDSLELYNFSDNLSQFEQDLTRYDMEIVPALLVLAASTRDKKWRQTYRTMLIHALDIKMVNSERKLHGLQHALADDFTFKGNHVRALEIMARYEPWPLYNSLYIQNALTGLEFESSETHFSIIRYAKSAIPQRYLTSLALLTLIFMQICLLFDPSEMPTFAMLITVAVYAFSFFIEALVRWSAYRSTFGLGIILRLLFSVLIVLSAILHISAIESGNIETYQEFHALSYAILALSSFPLWLYFYLSISTHTARTHRQSIFIELIIEKSLWVLPFALTVIISILHAFSALHGVYQSTFDTILRILLGLTDYEMSYLYRPIAGRVALITSSILVAITTGLILASYLETMRSDIWIEVENRRILRLTIDINETYKRALSPPFNLFLVPVIRYFMYNFITVPINVVLFSLPLVAYRHIRNFAVRHSSSQFHLMD